MQKNSRLGFFINDLQRNPLAYHSIKILTALFSRSYMVKNDAPLSVLRGFSKSELESMMKTAFGEPVTITFEIHWKWAFRWLLIGYQPLAMK
jgi:hypothetical protein